MGFDIWHERRRAGRRAAVWTRWPNEAAGHVAAGKAVAEIFRRWPETILVTVSRRQEQPKEKAKRR